MELASFPGFLFSFLNLKFELLNRNRLITLEIKRKMHVSNFSLLLPVIAF